MSSKSLFCVLKPTWSKSVRNKEHGLQLISPKLQSEWRLALHKCTYIGLCFESKCFINSSGIGTPIFKQTKFDIMCLHAYLLSLVSGKRIAACNISLDERLELPSSFWPGLCTSVVINAPLRTKPWYVLLPQLYSLTVVWRWANSLTILIWGGLSIDWSLVLTWETKTVTSCSPTMIMQIRSADIHSQTSQSRGRERDTERER